MKPNPDRRDFLSRLILASTGTCVAPLALLYSRLASGECAGSPSGTGFGPLAPALPRNAARLRFTGDGDLSREPLVALPSGFSYTALSITGQPMTDGQLVPGRHDGMGCFQKRDAQHADRFSREYILIRNHELLNDDRQFGNREGVVVPGHRKWDPAVKAGGTTTLKIDASGELLSDFASLGGTIRNCAGGVTPWNTWLTCEETIDTPETDGELSQKHGYVFEVSITDRPHAQTAQPLTAMGRFNHEAAAVDPQSGDVFLTEDRGDSAIYRFVPDKPNPDKRLENSGRLFALKIMPGQRADCDGTPIPTAEHNKESVDTSRNVRAFLGQRLKTEWVELENVDSNEDSLRHQAQAKGATIFVRGEGMWQDQGRIYWCCSSGGDHELGQVFEYEPATETTRLVVESERQGDLDKPDNITLGPDSTIYVAEDGPGENGVKGVDRSGGLFPFLLNVLNDSELAGICFSPDGTRLFVNMQKPGITLCLFKDDDSRIVLPV